MSAPFRIENPKYLAGPTPEAGDSIRHYLDRLMKLIPAEIVGLYSIGKGFIPETNASALAVWVGVCLILLVILRIYGTADPSKNETYQGFPVFISAIAFLIWVYSLGGVFQLYGVYIPWVGSLLVLVWSFVIPIVYKGPQPTAL